MFDVLVGKSGGVMKVFLLPDDDNGEGELREISMEESVGKKMIFLCPEECEYSKILRVPVVVGRKQRQIIEAEIKSEMPKGENCGYVYKILSKNEEYLILLLTLFRKKEVDDYVDFLEKFGGRVEMVVPGAYFLVSQGRKVQAKWGEALYLSHMDHSNPWIKRSDMLDSSFVSDTAAYCEHFEDSFEVGQYEDMLGIIVECVNWDKSLEFNLLSRQKRVRNGFINNKLRLIFSIAAILMVSVLGVYHLSVKRGNYFEASRLIDQRYDFVSGMNLRLREQISVMKRYNEVIDRYNFGFEDAKKVEIIFKTVDEATPPFIVISLIRADAVKEELVLEGHTDSLKFGEIEKYLESLRRLKLFSSVEDMEVKENKKLGQWDFAFRLSLRGEGDV